jgi:4-amino-4-deoxy-L-arabinose transferase-like glycosyltransferase
MFEDFKKKYRKNPLRFLFLTIIFFLALFLRVYRIQDLLGFWYDQGREALVIWDFIHKGKFFLIGPTTGIAGIFRGPWYYWILTPFYFLGQGDPVYPAIFQVLTTLFSIYLLYKIALKYFGRLTAYISLTIASFSYAIIMSSRWFSAPPLMYLLSTAYIYSLFLVTENYRWAYLIAGLIAGLSMQIGSAAAIFYLPTTIIIGLLFAKKNFNFRNLFLYIASYTFTFLPQIIFDVRHQGVQLKGLLSFYNTQKPVSLSFFEVLTTRMQFYYEMFSSKLWVEGGVLLAIFFLLFLFGLVVFAKQLVKNKYTLSLFILFSLPLVGMLFFQGNKGNVYDYYFTGYYYVFILLFSIVLSKYANFWTGKILIALFVALFLFNNLPRTYEYLTASYRMPEIITLANQKEVIDWIYKDASDKNFNVDVYVPPVVPYAYDYLFLWYGDGNYGKVPDKENTSLLYTLSERDLEHPERLKAWEKRQDTIGRVVKTEDFGLIKVERRERISHE